MIDSLIRQGRSFAIYRIPGEEEPRFVMQASGSARLLYNIEDLNEQQGFVIAPFRVSRECPIVLIRRDYSELPDNSQPDYIRMDLEFHPNGTENPSERKTKDNYTQRLFIRPANSISVLMFTSAIHRKRASGWEEPQKLSSREKRANGIRLRWQEHSLYRTANCRLIGMRKTKGNNN